MFQVLGSSPSGVTGPRAVACEPCRRKKLKCDLEQPTCGRCMKGRFPSQCTYINGVPSKRIKITSSSTDPDDGAPNSHTAPDAEAPRAFMSTVKASNSTGPSFSQPLIQNDISYREAGAISQTVAGVGQPGSADHVLINKPMFKQNSTRTRFGGSGIMAGILSQFPSLDSIMRELISSSWILSRIGEDLSRIKLKHHKARLEERNNIPELATLIALIPSREVVDTLVDQYFLCIESTHRILHIGSFRQELEKFWTNPASASAPFVVQLLLVLACAETVCETSQPSRTTGRLPIIDWIHYCERWIEITRSRSVDLTDLQIHCLLIIAKLRQNLHHNRMWLATSNVVRLAMHAGYHRDPEHIGKISLFEMEMRRRIWVTIVELDVQIGFDQGMTPSLKPSDYDTKVPLNINDQELYNTMSTLPSSRSLDELTDCSFQSILAESLHLRLQICALVNSPLIDCCYTDVQRLELSLERIQVVHPTWTMSAANDDQRSSAIILWTSILETKLSQSLLALHTPFVIEKIGTQLYSPSGRAQLEASVAVLSRQQSLHQISEKFCFCHFSDSTLQAALSVLHNIYTNRPAYGSLILSQDLPMFTSSLQLVEKTLACMEAWIPVIVKAIKPYFLLSAILVIVKLKLWPDKAESIKREASEDLGKFWYTVLAYNASTSVRTHMGMNDQQRRSEDVAANAQLDASNELTAPSNSSGVIVPDLMLPENALLNASGTSNLDGTESIHEWLDMFDWDDPFIGPGGSFVL